MTRLPRRPPVRDGVRLAGDLAAPVVFVYVRCGPSAAVGEPYYQRRLDAEMRIGDRAIAAGTAAARRAGVRASGEQLHGAPARRLEEFARLRDAQFVVVGARRRWLPRSVSRALIAAWTARCWWLGLRVRRRPDPTPTARSRRGPISPARRSIAAREGLTGARPRDAQRTIVSSSRGRPFVRQPRVNATLRPDTRQLRLWTMTGSPVQLRAECHGRIEASVLVRAPYDPQETPHVRAVAPTSAGSGRRAGGQLKIAGLGREAPTAMRTSGLLRGLQNDHGSVRRNSPANVHVFGDV